MSSGLAVALLQGLMGGIIFATILFIIAAIRWRKKRWDDVSRKEMKTKNRKEDTDAQ